MNNLATLLTASLLFHTASSSKAPKSSHGPKSPKNEFAIKSSVAIGLLKTFSNEGFATEDTPKIYVTRSDSLLPFDFPIFESYDMDLASRLSKRVGLSAPFIFSYLVQVIYKLVLFHVRRFFKLETYEPLAENISPKSQEWYDNPQKWFHTLFNAIMPGAVFYPYDHYEPIKLEHIHVEPFTFLKSGDIMFAFTKYVYGGPRKYIVRREEKIPTVVVYTLPSSFLGQTLEARQTIFIGVNLERSYPHCKEILEHLLKGVTFAFDLTGSNLEVIVKSTEDIPPVEESMHTLRELLETPLETQIVIPEDIERALHNGMIPRLSCYHPANGFLSSIELYERMMMLIVMGRALVISRLRPDCSLNSIVDDLSFWLHKYLPGVSVKRCIGDLSKVPLYTYLSDPLRMWIYKGEVDGEETGILLEFGEPVMLTHEQLNNLMSVLYPYSFRISALENAETPVEKILECVIGEIKKRTAPPPSSLKTTGKDTAKTSAHAPINLNSKKGKKALNAAVRSLDNRSRNYSQNTASRFESPSVQRRVYEQARKASLEDMFGSKVRIAFNADKHFSIAGVRPYEVVHLPSGSSGSVTESYFYYSCHNKNQKACEGVEMVSFPPGFDISKLISIPSAKYTKDPMFQDHHDVNRIGSK